MADQDSISIARDPGGPGGPGGDVEDLAVTEQREAARAREVWGG